MMVPYDRTMASEVCYSDAGVLLEFYFDALFYMLCWQSIPFWIEQTHALGVPLGHVLEGYFEADWKPVKKFFREHSNYHDTERDIMSFRAFQKAHSVAVTQYGIPNTSGVSVPATDMLNLLICPCITASSLFVSNERLWCQHLKNVGADTYVDQDAQTKNHPVADCWQQ